MFAQTESSGAPTDPMDELDDLLLRIEGDVKKNPENGFDKKSVKQYIAKTV